MFRFNDSVKIKEVEKLYGRSEELIKTLEEIKEKGVIGKVLSIDEEDCILTVYVSFKGYDNLWMAEEELEKVNAYENLKIVENIDDFIDAMKKVYEEEMKDEVDIQEVELEEVERDLDEVVRNAEDNTNRELLDFLIDKFGYSGREEVLDDFFRNKLVNHVMGDYSLFDNEDLFTIATTVDIILDLFGLNSTDIQIALERKEFERKNRIQKIDDDDDLIF